MDRQRFDDLTRVLAKGADRRTTGVSSRRTVLKALVGSVLGVVATRTVEDDAVDAAGKNGKRPRRTSDAARGACGVCQNGRCTSNDAACPGCAVCDASSPTCRSKCRRGQLCCGETGVCGPVGVCCAGEADCGECQDRVDGTCVPSPLMQGRECGDCKRCRGGACSVSDPRILCDGVCCDATSVCSGQGCCDVADLCGDACCCEVGTENCAATDGSHATPR